MIHELKQVQPHFDDVLSGNKTFEVRKHDRPFHVGDLLALNEYNPTTQTYTGRSCLVYVDYILKDPNYVKSGYVIMAIKPCLAFRRGDPYSAIKRAEDYTVPLATEKDERISL